MIARIGIPALAVTLLSAPASRGGESVKLGADLEAVVAGFKQRVDAIFKAEAGRPLARGDRLASA